MLVIMLRAKLGPARPRAVARGTARHTAHAGLLVDCSRWR
jgi:hypothetical protein